MVGRLIGTDAMLQDVYRGEKSVSTGFWMTQCVLEQTQGSGQEVYPSIFLCFMLYYLAWRVTTQG
jgi:hypothetical protein